MGIVYKIAMQKFSGNERIISTQNKRTLFCESKNSKCFICYIAESKKSQEEEKEKDKDKEKD